MYITHSRYDIRYTTYYMLHTAYYILYYYILLRSMDYRLCTVCQTYASWEAHFSWNWKCPPVAFILSYSRGNN